MTQQGGRKGRSGETNRFLAWIHSYKIALVQILHMVVWCNDACPKDVASLPCGSKCMCKFPWKSRGQEIGRGGKLVYQSEAKTPGICPLATGLQLEVFTFRQTEREEM